MTGLLATGSRSLVGRLARFAVGAKKHHEKNSSSSIQFFQHNSGTDISLVSRDYLRCCWFRDAKIDGNWFSTFN